MRELVPENHRPQQRLIGDLCLLGVLLNLVESEFEEPFDQDGAGTEQVFGEPAPLTVDALPVQGSVVEAVRVVVYS